MRAGRELHEAVDAALHAQERAAEHVVAKQLARVSRCLRLGRREVAFLAGGEGVEAVGVRHECKARLYNGAKVSTTCSAKVKWSFTRVPLAGAGPQRTGAVGVELFGQAAVGAVGTNPFGWVATAGIALRVGAR